MEKGTALLGIQPEELHQRAPLLIGSAGDAEEAERFIQGKAEK
jgi:fructose-1,6-bisphosphatase